MLYSLIRKNNEKKLDLLHIYLDLIFFRLDESGGSQGRYFFLVRLWAEKNKTNLQSASANQGELRKC
jgi:hypothetical protein